MDQNRDVDSILESLWDRLERAADRPSEAFRRLSFGTVRAQAPRVRSVILRRVEPGERRLSFHTDRRSEKVTEIRSNERAAWHGWDPERRIQIRLRGQATIHVDDRVCDELWSSQAPRSLVHYCQETPPGQVMETPGGGEGTQSDESLTHEDVARGRPNFAVVRTSIDSIDWLRLRRKGDLRARFRFNRRRRAFEGAWIAP